MADEEKNLPQEPEDIFESVEKSPASVKGEVQDKPEKDTALKIPIKEKKEKKPRNWKKFIRPVIIIIIIVIVGFGIFYGQAKIRDFLSSKKSPGTTPTVIQGTGEGGTTPSDVTPLAPEVLDLDADGLLNIEEDELGTDKNNPDSDGDGLFDREEVKIYLTNPLNPDSDGDGVSDGQEVRQGKDPNDPSPEASLLDLQEEINKLK